MKYAQLWVCGPAVDSFPLMTAGGPVCVWKRAWSAAFRGWMRSWFSIDYRSHHWRCVRPKWKLARIGLVWDADKKDWRFAPGKESRQDEPVVWLKQFTAAPPKPVKPSAQPAAAGGPVRPKKPDESPVVSLLRHTVDKPTSIQADCSWDLVFTDDPGTALVGQPDSDPVAMRVTGKVLELPKGYPFLRSPECGVKWHPVYSDAQGFGCDVPARVKSLSVTAGAWIVLT